LAEDLASQCDVTTAGVELSELERIVRSFPELSASKERLTWDGLRQLDGVAILLVNNNHYITVDTREKTIWGHAKVRVYDWKKPARWWARKDMELVWRGEALAIRRQVGHAPEIVSGPLAAWETCFIDRGVVRETMVEPYRFAFRNAGNEVLIIDEIRRSCRCADVRASSMRLAPGESGYIEASVNLTGQVGYFDHHLVVISNDVSNPAVFLRLAGGVPRKHVLSAEVVRLEDLPRGGKVKFELYACDPGFDGFRIREATFTLRGNLDMGEHLVCAISYELVGKEAQRLGKLTGYQLKPEDHIIHLEFEAAKSCPIGHLQGNIDVVIDAGDATATHTVAIEGAVVPDVYSIPDVALIMLGHGGAGSAVLRLHKHSQQSFRITKTWTDGKIPLEIERRGVLEDKSHSFSISASMPDGDFGEVPLESAVFFETRDGTVLRVPVVVFTLPHLGRSPD